MVKNLKCTAGSKILENYYPVEDATSVKKIKEKGGIILGKTNLDEFAMGSSTEYSAFFKTKNPIDKERVPGGSSGGSAVAVALNMVQVALGSDTGGSIRQPASFCGVVGFKPTYGAVSRYGLIAMASSLDQIGTFSKKVKDTEILFKAIIGKDPLDSTSVSIENFKPEREIKLSNLKVGIPKEYFGEGIDSEVKRVILDSLKVLEKEGVQIIEISLPLTEYALPTYYIIMSSEVSANLARYDGVRYGRSKMKEAQDIWENFILTRTEYLGSEVKRRIMLGTFCLSSGYYQAFYGKATKVRALIQKEFQKAFEKVDFIITPTTPEVAFKFGEKTKDPIKMYYSDILTVPVNLAYLPAISIPAGKVENLPVGVQIIANLFEDFNLLKFAEIYESKLQTN